MLKMKKMVIIGIFTICLLFAMGFEMIVTATSVEQLDLNLTIKNDKDTNAILANEIAANEIASNSQIVQPNTNESTNGLGILPQTGVTEDITVMFFIIVCVVSAIYAYGKIKNSNV